MERWERLRPGGYRFPADPAHPPGTDTFLLSALPRLRPGLRVCDLGCGAGLLGLLLLQRQAALRVTGVELREEAVRLARTAARENGLEDRMEVLQGDVRQVRALLPGGGFDLCAANPPYFPAGGGPEAPDPGRRAARSEAGLSLDELCAAAAYLLRQGGALCLVHRAERLADLLCALRRAGLEPKRLRFVESRAGAAPSLVLAEARRGGRPGLAVEPALVLTGPDGRPTAEHDAIYFRTEEDGT